MKPIVNIVGIETSCDETAVAIVRSGTTVLSSVVASSADYQANFGGVVPEIAARAHLQSIGPTFDQALEQSGLALSEIDAIAVSQGPGLVGALLVGASFARGLSDRLSLPLIPVNHVHAHVHGALLGLSKDADSLFPAIALVVSGGHTNLYYMPSPCQFELKAYSIDDACGESFDKVAKMLGLGYPGGPLIEQKALAGNEKAFAMPKMMADNKKRIFSYSGLKTHASLLIRQLAEEGKGTLSEKSIADLCASFQREAFRQVISMLGEVIKESNSAVNSLIIAGGVAANRYFQKEVQNAISIPAYFPHPSFCSDNGAMIAALAWHQRHDSGIAQEWDVFSRYSF